MIITVSPWRDLPEKVLVPGQVFAIGDVHGHADLLDLLLHRLITFKRDDETEIIFLGDLIDRGPESFRALDLAFDSALVYERCTVLPGNHEGLLLKALADRATTSQVIDWFRNGGNAVFFELDPQSTLTIPEILARIRVKVGHPRLMSLLNAPSHVRRGNVVFVHGGLNPSRLTAEFLAQPIWAEEYDDHWAWIREPFLEWTGGWGDAGLVVHGHSIENKAPLRDIEDLLTAADRTVDHRRISLEHGAQMGYSVSAAEFRDGRFRIIAALKPPLCPQNL